MARKELAEVYLHIGNSGATFKVVDEGKGPQLELTSSAFGNLENKFTLMTDTDGLKAIRDAIDQSLLHQFSEEYCHKARVLEEENCGTQCSE